ncbi:MAG: tetratricopeptide repeat protein [Pirellulaceae bacterium]|nr:tetratricopeptide repeat protein [Pirellulaceae bacterium]
MITACLWLVLAARSSSHAQSVPPLTVQQAVGDQSAKDAPTELVEAVRHYNAGQFEATLKLLDQAAARNTDFHPARPTLARFHLLTGRVAEARAVLELFGAESPQEPEVYRLLGELAFREFRLVEAELLFRELLDKSHAYAISQHRKKQYQIAGHAGLAAVAERRAQWSVAAGHLSEWIALDATNSGAHQRLAEAQFELGKVREAYSSLQIAQQNSVPTFSAEVAMGLMYDQAGQRETAESWMKQALNTAPDQPHVLLAVAQWYWDNDQPQSAQQPIATALLISPQSAQARLLAALVAWQAGKLELAIEHFHVAARLEPGNALIAHQLARALVETGDAKHLQDARVLAEASVKQMPADSNIAATLGWVYLKLELLPEAEQIFKRIALGGQVQPDAAYFLACFAERTGKRAAAVKTLRASLDTPGPYLYRKQAEQLLKQIDP